MAEHKENGTPIAVSATLLTRPPGETPVSTPGYSGSNPSVSPLRERIEVVGERA